ncbi:MAG: cytochrome c [Pseudomonadota bacterium]
MITDIAARFGAPLALLLALAAWSAPAASADDAEALVERDCTSCHGAEVYTRSNRMVGSMQDLRTQIQRCHRAAGKNWSAQDVDQVVKYLNDRYYRF